MLDVSQASKNGNKKKMNGRKSPEQKRTREMRRHYHNHYHKHKHNHYHKQCPDKK